MNEFIQADNVYIITHLGGQSLTHVTRNAAAPMSSLTKDAVFSTILHSNNLLGTILQRGSGYSWMLDLEPLVPQCIVMHPPVLEATKGKEVSRDRQEDAPQELRKLSPSDISIS